MQEPRLPRQLPAPAFLLRPLPTLLLLLLLLPTVSSQETFCPPPVQRFLRINNSSFRRLNGARLHSEQQVGGPAFLQTSNLCDNL